MKPIVRRSFIPDLLLPALVALIGLAASLGMGLRAPPDATRLAVLVPPLVGEGWGAINRSGLPVVKTLMGGWLVVVDGAGHPRQLALLRAAPVIVLDARRVPGCGSGDTSQIERISHAPDA
jgi:hypothetical protein